MDITEATPETKPVGRQSFVHALVRWLLDHIHLWRVTERRALLWGGDRPFRRRCCLCGAEQTYRLIDGRWN